jgi:hypothetical protein
LLLITGKHLKIWKKDKLISEMNLKIWKISKSNSEKIWKIQKIIFCLSFHYFLLYFPNLLTIQLIFLPYFPYHFTFQLAFLPCCPYLITIRPSWIVKRFRKYRRKLWKDMKNMEEKFFFVIYNFINDPTPRKIDCWLVFQTLYIYIYIYIYNICFSFF